MIILVVLIAALALAFLRGGKIEYLADLPLKWRGIIIAGFLIQIIVFNDFWQNNSDLKKLTALSYLVSLTLLLLAVVKNHALPGMIIIAAGFFSNSLTILMNGGYMPASIDAWQIAGFSHLAPGQTYNNSIGMDSGTLLPFLGDIFAIPKGFIFPNVFSIGDVLIAIGAVYLIQKALVKPKKK